MITLAPISSNIQDTLFQKMAMLSAGGNQTVSKLENGIWAPSNQIINSEVTTDGKLVTNYMNARTVWMRMTSFTPESGTKNTAVVIIFKNPKIKSHIRRKKCPNSKISCKKQSQSRTAKCYRKENILKNSHCLYRLGFITRKSSEMLDVRVFTRK